MTVTSTTPTNTQPAASNNHQRRRWLLGLALVFVVAAIAFSLYWFLIGRYSVSTDDAYVNGNSVQVMSQISGQVISILADETNLVTKGSILIELDKANVEIALKSAESQLALSARQVSQYYDSVYQYQANVQLQQDNLEKTNQDYKRREGLVVNKTISVEELQHAKIAVDAAKHELALAKQQLASTEALVGSTDLYHHPIIQQAAVNYRTAYLNWRRASIYAPATGYIAKRSVQVGQQVTPNNTLMIIVPLNEIWVDANFKESQLRHIRIGQKVSMVSDAYSGKYHGVVIGLNPGTGSAFDLLPPQNATGNWIKIVQRLPVRIKIDPNELVKRPLQIGLSMTVSIDITNKSGEILSQKASNTVVYSSLDYSNDLKKADEMIQAILQANAKNIHYDKGT